MHHVLDSLGGWQQTPGEGLDSGGGQREVSDALGIGGIVEEELGEGPPSHPHNESFVIVHLYQVMTQQVLRELVLQPVGDLIRDVE